MVNVYSEQVSSKSYNTWSLRYEISIKGERVNLQGKLLYHFPLCLPSQWAQLFNPNVLRTANTLWSFGHPECSGVTVQILCIGTVRSQQTAQTKIRLLLLRVYAICHSISIFWMH